MITPGLFDYWVFLLYRKPQKDLQSPKYSLEILVYFKHSSENI